MKRFQRKHILGCWLTVNAESLENKGIPRFSFRFESTSAQHKKDIPIGVSFLFVVKGCNESRLSVRRASFVRL